MAKPTEINKKNYRDFIKKAESADKSLRGLVQRLVLFGMNHYSDSHNSNPLTEIMNAKLPSIRTEAIKVYIQDHTDLIFEKVEGAEMPVFKRHEKDGFEYKTPDVTWWEYSGIGKVSAFNPDTSIETWTKQVGNLDAGKGTREIEKGQEAETEHLFAFLKTFQPLQDSAVN